ncbi:MAG: hypothetical protein GXP50_05210 [Deltaproteobacteria bacterium]|nr:hypothetical protein [Deltaproteobacteria bacterium]
MKRAVIVAVLLALGPAARAGEMAPGFQPPEKKIEKPYTNDKCLKNCHGVPGFSAGGPDGALRDLYVDAEEFVLSTHGQKGVECIDCHRDADPNFHPRTGYPKVDCRACHAKNPPADAYPPDALARLKAKGIKPPPEEARKAEGWLKTKHGQAFARGDEKAPFCTDCHTAHRIRKPDDPASTVNRANLASTCGRCHADRLETGRVGVWLARFRIGAHGKGDLANRYDVTECASCHQGEAAHGERSVTGQACPTCHRVAEEGGREWATLHVRPGSGEQPLAWALSWLYEAGFWAAVAGGVLIAVFWGFTSLFRRDDG